jgi:hypothetical protein
LEDRKAVTQLLPSDFLALGDALQDGIDKEGCIREAMYCHLNKETFQAPCHQVFIHNINFVFDNSIRIPLHPFFH